MNHEQRKKIYSEAITIYGKTSQLEMAQEEATELALAVRKFVRQPNKLRVNNLIEEMADMEIMEEQIHLMFPTFRKRIDTIKNLKLQRLQREIEIAQSHGNK